MREFFTRVARLCRRPFPARGPLGLRLEPLEDRLVLSWGSIPPSTITPW